MLSVIGYLVIGLAICLIVQAKANTLTAGLPSPPPPQIPESVDATVFKQVFGILLLSDVTDYVE